MSVHFLEERLPEGFEPNRLGQSSSGENNIGHLISLIESPLTHERPNVYVVFITDGKEVESYKWTIRNTDRDMPDIKITTSIGRIAWRPGIDTEKNESETYQITVDIIRSGDIVDFMNLEQVVKKPDHLFEDAISPKINKKQRERLKSIAGFNVGNRLVLSRLYYDFPAACSDKLRCVLLYASGLNKKDSESLQLKYSKKHLGPNKVIEIKKVQSKVSLLRGNRNRGIAGLSPALVAHYCLNCTGVKDSDIKSLRNLKKAYNDLDEYKKIDICNILRFPKSNIEMLSQLSDKFIEKWEQFAEEEELEKPTRLKRKALVLATFFETGGPRLTAINKKKSKFRLKKTGLPSATKVALRISAIELFLLQNNPAQKLIDEWKGYKDEKDEKGKNKVYRHFRQGIFHYISISISYKKQGVLNGQALGDWIMENIVSIRLPDKVCTSVNKFALENGTKPYNKIFINKSIKKALEEVFDVVKKEEAIQITQIGGFVPRLISGRKKLSKHARGLGIDFDFRTNPMLTKAEERKLEDAFNIKLVGKRLNFVEAFTLNEKFMQAPDNFLGFDITDSAIYRLYKYKYSGGLMTLRKELVEAMKKEFDWGGNWEFPKDFMHFEKK